MKHMRAVESDSVKSARKLQKTCERVSEIHERNLHRQEQDRMRMASMRESRGRLKVILTIYIIVQTLRLTLQQTS